MISLNNIINAIYNLVTNPILDLKGIYGGKNRANSSGDALEVYIKDLFANTVNSDEEGRLEGWSETFSYTGNNSNPPDAMLFGGDAIEIKKIETDNSALVLNSSYPKQKLFSSSGMISEACRNAEKWSVKDMLYCVGTVKNMRLRHLAMVYGMDYCASETTYTRIKSKIKSGIEEIPNIELSETNELGRLNKIDPLGITYLRIRGMWGIENPFHVFNYLYRRNGKIFNFMCIIDEEKYYSFQNYRIIEELCGKITGFTICDVKVKNPDNPVQLRRAKLITFER